MKPRTRIPVGFGLLSALAWVGLLAPPASADQTFEVAIIKPAPLPQQRGRFHLGYRVDRAHGLFGCDYCSLKSMLAYAYGVPSYQVVGPAWFDEETYIVEARMAAGVSQPDVLAMLRSLLKERFEMNSHNELRPVPMYILTARKGTLRIKPAEKLATSGTSAIRGIVSTGLSMDLLAGSLSRHLTYPVFNKTGMDGPYEVSVTWPPPEQSGMDSDIDIRRAVKDQLGLELTLGKVESNLIVIDAARKVPINN